MDQSRARIPSPTQGPAPTTDAPGNGTSNQDRQANLRGRTGGNAGGGDGGNPKPGELPAGPISLADLGGEELSRREVASRVASTRADGRYATMVAALPKGAKLDASQRRQLLRIAQLGGLDAAALRQLFTVRFGLNIQNGDGASWTTETILQVWTALDVLPDQDVTRNNMMSTVRATGGGGGTYEEGQKAIVLGQENGDDFMDDTVRHEVGHAVHASLRSTVDAWLKGTMKMWYYTQDQAASWIGDLGGWPATYKKDGRDVAFGENQKKAFLGMLKSYMGGAAGWKPAREQLHDGTADGQAIAEAQLPAVTNAIAQSKENWYTNLANFQAGANGKYYLNYYYKTLCYIGPTAEAAAKACGRSDNYAVMSYQEFFAECYNEYFRNPAGYSDPSKWGGRLPADVKSFFQDKIVNRASPGGGGGGGARNPTEGDPKGVKANGIAPPG